LSDFIEWGHDLLSAGDVRISEHGYDELAEDGLVTGMTAKTLKIMKRSLWADL
jgi:hypothetical protein